MYTVGIDVGSSSCKAVLWGNDRCEYVIIPTGWSPKQAGREAYQKLLSQAGVVPNEVKYRVATGYGRISLDFIDEAVTEITCHAQGAKYLFPLAELIIDIGGQDSKVIVLNSRGGVVDFAMNDKCSAGTGKFLEIMANALGSDPAEIGATVTVQDPITISSMCTVFAETEVIGLLAEGIDKRRIIAGIHAAVAQRVANMANRLGDFQVVVFTGGVAKNTGVKKKLSQLLGAELLVPAEPQIVGALGAALIGWKKLIGGGLLWG